MERSPSVPVVDFRNVLVPLDGSEFSLRAMPTARVLAQRFDADLHTIAVADDDRDAARVRSLAAAALAVAPDDQRVHVLTRADPADAIVRRAESLGACVVCLATHGRGSVSRLWLGSIATSVLQRSVQPVLLVRVQAQQRPVRTGDLSAHAR